MKGQINTMSLEQTINQQLNRNPRIKKGMVFAVEPMLNLGTANIVMLDDNWTIETEDYSPSAHFEHTVVVTDDGYEILTGVMQNGKE